ncbi:MAG: PQQ-dependent sugar dehydrogenase [Verrucomicrobiota bacterium]
MPTALGQAPLPGIDSPQPIGAFLNGNLPSAIPGAGTGDWQVVDAFPNLSFTDPVLLLPKPNSTDLFIVGKTGHIYQIPNNPAATPGDITTILDVSATTRHDGDTGLLSMAFHPEFGQGGSPNRGYFYIWYRHTPTPAYEDSFYTPAYIRLTRFNIPDGQTVADPNSEFVMIQQFDNHDWHNGGGLFFGDDDFLYIAVGDEGGANDEFDSSQKIDEALLGGVLRIDVDQDLSRSHPIRRQPQNPPLTPFQPPWPAGQWPPVSFTQGYTIPNDNPWLDPGGGNLEEFWAIGLRSPHTMTRDPVTGLVFIGDVGQSSREEIDVLEKAANYQWPYQEGAFGGPKSQPNPIIGNDTPPVWDYGRNEGGCVIGGVVYRGAIHSAELGGKYLFGDHNSRHIWAMTYSPGQNPTVELLAEMPPTTGEKGQLASFGVDHQGEVYMCKPFDTGNPNGKIYKLIRGGTQTPPPPPLLSQTGAFPNLANLTPAPGLIPYDVNTPLWSDGALKSRWLAIPNDGTHNSGPEEIIFSENGNWTFPIGTVIVKHFEIPIDERFPNGPRRRLETRFLVRANSGDYYAMTYKWRLDSSDADLVPNTGENEIINITNAAGQPVALDWLFPGTGACMTCHTQPSGRVLGLRTRQQNGDYFYAATNRTANQLFTLNHLGIFNPSINPADLPNMLTSKAVDDTDATLQRRALSYLDSNCAQCHQPGTSAGSQALFDARLSTPPGSQNIVGAPVVGDLGITGAQNVKPQDTAASILYQRFNSLGGCCAMPPLAKNRLDAPAIQLISDWINSLDPVAWSAVTTTNDLGEPQATLSTNSPTVPSPFLADVSFSENIDGLTPADFIVTNGTITALAGSGSNYSLTILANSAGSVTIQLPSDTVIDSAGNSNPASNLLDVTSTGLAGPPPTPTLATASTEITGPFDVTIAFTTAVTGLADTDFTLANATPDSLTGTAANYTLTLSPVATGPVTITLPAGTVTDALGAPNTNSNQIIVNYTGPVVPPPGTQLPFGGNATPLPGLIEAEHYDEGGEGISYDDLEPENLGAVYSPISFRPAEGVDVEPSGDTPDTPSVGWFDNSEWMEYTVAPTPGTYDVQIRVASNEDDPGDLRLLLNGVELGMYPVEFTGGWDQWQTLTLTNVNVPTPGEQILRVEAIGNGVNVNWIQFNLLATSAQNALDQFLTQYNVTGPEATPTGDVDNDTANHFMELAFGTDPNNATANPPIIPGMQSVDGLPYLTLSFPVIAGGTTAPDSASHYASGITYRPRASSNGTNFSIPTTLAPNPLTLPPPPAGYQWITFRSTISGAPTLLRIELDADF